jgi:hypothetical protein
MGTHYYAQKVINPVVQVTDTVSFGQTGSMLKFISSLPLQEPIMVSGRFSTAMHEGRPSEVFQKIGRLFAEGTKLNIHGLHVDSSHSHLILRLEWNANSVENMTTASIWKFFFNQDYSRAHVETNLVLVHPDSDSTLMLKDIQIDPDLTRGKKFLDIEMIMSSRACLLFSLEVISVTRPQPFPHPN